MSHLHRLKRLAAEHHRQAAQTFHRTHRHAKHLLKKHKVVIHKIRHHAVRTTAVATVSSSLVATPLLAAVPIPNSNASKNTEKLQQQIMEEYLRTNPQGEIANVQVLPDTPTDQPLAESRVPVPERIKQVMPEFSPNMTGAQEEQFSQLIMEYYGIPAKAELEGIRLNATRGVIAGEQHLPLYPGDTLANHRSDPTANLTGMVPGLPAWGYFASSKKALTQKDIERERYYIAAQTFVSPGWDQNVEKMYKWFKYRKMIMINAKTGSAVVVVIGDAGPNPRLKSTVDGVRRNRTYGGSNEVLIGLGLGMARVGDVFAFFVDDPEDKIPLGPITHK